MVFSDAVPFPLVASPTALAVVSRNLMQRVSAIQASHRADGGMGRPPMGLSKTDDGLRPQRP